MKLSVYTLATFSILIGGFLIGCEYSSPEAVRRCNSPTATLDDPKMWDCYSFDRAANDRMLAKKKAEIDARIKADGGLKSPTSDPIAQRSAMPACREAGMQSSFVITTCRP